jgi:hypothetical protein
MKDLEDQLQTSISFLSIAEVCNEPRKYNASESSERDAPSKPLIKYFQVPDSVLQFAELIYEAENSVVFSNMWQSYCLNAAKYLTGSMKFTLCDVASYLWLPCKQEWTELCTRFMQASISVQQVDAILGYCKFDYELQREMSIMFRWIKKDETVTTLAAERLDQIRLYKQVANYYSSIHEILQARDLLKLSGDFTDLENLLKLVSICYEYYNQSC